MALLLIKTLVMAGNEVEIASSFRAYEGRGDTAQQDTLRIGAEREAARLIARYQGRDKEYQPELWFSYHVYYKSPDWIGPLVARALDIPYVVAEASYAASRAAGPWAIGHLGAEIAIKSANLIFSMTTIDRDGLEQVLGPGQTHRDLPPFLDPAPYGAVSRILPQAGEPVRLLAVGMMRRGDKAESYRRLAEYLQRLERPDWNLAVIGDGPARAEVEGVLAALGPERVRFLGARPKIEMPRLYAGADIYVWPAAGEAYGMALLEAQASGLPVVAGKVRGVIDVVLDGQTGFLTPEGDADAFVGVIDFLIADAEARVAMGETGKRFVNNMRTMERAAIVLNAGLTGLLRDRRQAPQNWWSRIWHRR